MLSSRFVVARSSRNPRTQTQMTWKAKQARVQSNTISLAIADETRVLGEIEPVVGVEDGRGEEEKEYRAGGTRFIAFAVKTHDEKDCPEEANHHRKRNYPFIQHTLARYLLTKGRM